MLAEGVAQHLVLETLWCVPKCPTPGCWLDVCVCSEQPLTVLAFCPTSLLTCLHFCASLGSLANNFVEVEGAKHIAGAVQTNSTLRNLKCAAIS